jgi:hypothetical protein
LAEMKLSEFRKQMFMGKLDIQAELPSQTVSEIWPIYRELCEVENLKYLDSVYRRQIKPTFGKCKIDLISPDLVHRWRERRLKQFVDKAKTKLVKFSTVNREQAVLSSFFSDVAKWVKIRKAGMPQIKLPPENPCSFIEKPGEKVFARERVPNRFELQQAKQWCKQNEPELWDAILQATVLMLRKADFMEVQESGATSGVQAKTGFAFKVRATFPKPATYNRGKWEKLQAAMGWKEFQEDGSPNPRSTVWHDLRHWGPTMLAEHGYGTKLIQKLTGHQTEAMAEKYTHLREEKILEAVEVVKREMESL